MTRWVWLFPGLAAENLGRATAGLGLGAAILAGPAFHLGRLGPDAAEASLHLPAVWALVAGSLVLFSGVAARPIREGEARLALVRPVSRVGFFLIHWGARLAWCAVAGAGLWATARWAAGPAAAGSVAGWVGTGLLVGIVLGGATLLASALLERGDALAVLASLLLPALVETLSERSPGGADAAGGLLVALVPPVPRAAEAAAALLTGGLPPLSVLGPLLLYAGAALLGASLRLARMEL